MKATWDGIALSDDANLSAQQHSLTLNGHQIVAETPLLRSYVSRILGYRNRVTDLAFTVDRTFETEGECEAFMLGHYTVLSDGPASLELITTATTLIFTGAVLESVAISKESGVCAEARYSFKCAGLSDDE